MNITQFNLYSPNKEKARLKNQNFGMNVNSDLTEQISFLNQAGKDYLKKIHFYNFIKAIKAHKATDGLKLTVRFGLDKGLSINLFGHKFRITKDANLFKFIISKGDFTENLRVLDNRKLFPDGEDCRILVNSNTEDLNSYGVLIDNEDGLKPYVARYSDKKVLASLPDDMLSKESKYQSLTGRNFSELESELKKNYD